MTRLDTHKNRFCNPLGGDRRDLIVAGTPNF